MIKPGVIFFIFFIRFLKSSEPDQLTIDLRKEVFSSPKSTVNEINYPILNKMITELAKEMNAPKISKAKIAKESGLMNFNAGALPYLKFIGGPFIIISQGLFKNLTYNEIRALLAHEIAHIKLHHGMKKIGLFLVLLKIFDPVLSDIDKKKNIVIDFNKKTVSSEWSVSKTRFIQSLVLALMTLPMSFLSRYFEKQADLEACKYIDPADLASAIKKTELLGSRLEIWEKIFNYYIPKKIRTLIKKVKFIIFSNHPKPKDRVNYLLKKAS